MKILVLNGSPKKKSDTFRLTEAFLKGLNRDGQHEVNIINVIEKKISPCMGCFGCWQRGNGHCVIEDDQKGGGGPHDPAGEDGHGAGGRRHGPP